MQHPKRGKNDCVAAITCDLRSCFVPALGQYLPRCLDNVCTLQDTHNRGKQTTSLRAFTLQGPSRPSKNQLLQAAQTTHSHALGSLEHFRDPRSVRLRHSCRCQFCSDMIGDALTCTHLFSRILAPPADTVCDKKRQSCKFITRQARLPCQVEPFNSHPGLDEPARN